MTLADRILNFLHAGAASRMELRMRLRTPVAELVRELTRLGAGGLVVCRNTPKVRHNNGTPCYIWELARTKKAGA